MQGHDVAREPRAAKSRMGIVPQEVALYEDLPAEENLRFWGEAYGSDRRAPGRAGPHSPRDRGTPGSRGRQGRNVQRRDEATAELRLRDRASAGSPPSRRAHGRRGPAERVRLLDLVREQAGAGVCVLYTTHYMEEAEALCDRLAILDHGRIIAAGRSRSCGLDGRARPRPAHGVARPGACARSREDARGRGGRGRRTRTGDARGDGRRAGCPRS